MPESIVFLLLVQCRHKESSRSLSHLLMSFLYTYVYTVLSKVDDFATFKKVEVHTKNSTFYRAAWNVDAVLR